MFRFAEDRILVVVITIITLIDFSLYFIAESTWVLASYWLLMLLPKGLFCAWNHHHQHLPTFRKVWLNRILEFMYGLQTGATTNLWVLHHNLGHHHNYLDQTKDQSRWKRADGSIMGEIEYAISVLTTAHYRAYQVGKRFPKAMKPFLIFTGLTFAFVALLTYLKPTAGLFVFILPMICSLAFTSWVTYEHHCGLETDNPFLASHNIMGKGFNLLTCNLGYHTAHHYRQGTHWSKLPRLHEEIKHNIPDHLFRDSIFSRLMSTD